MGLKEILAARLLASAPSPSEEKRVVTSGTFIAPNKDLFLAFWTPFLRDYQDFDFDLFLAYRDFLFKENERYVLGTFQQLDVERLFSILMQTNPPVHVRGAHQLAYILWKLQLEVPGFYQERLEEILYSFAGKNSIDTPPEIR